LYRYSESHMFQQYQDLGSSKVMVGGGSASTLLVNILWGIDGVDDKVGLVKVKLGLPIA
jgi:hypothetical protein